MYTESELRMIGMKCLSDRLGPVDAERFIVSMNRNAGDYTLARREVFDDMSIDEFRKSSREYMDSHRCRLRRSPASRHSRLRTIRTDGI